MKVECARDNQTVLGKNHVGSVPVRMKVAFVVTLIMNCEINLAGH